MGEDYRSKCSAVVEANAVRRFCCIVSESATELRSERGGAEEDYRSSCCACCDNVGELLCQRSPLANACFLALLRPVRDTSNARHIVMTSWVFDLQLEPTKFKKDLQEAKTSTDML